MSEPSRQRNVRPFAGLPVIVAAAYWLLLVVSTHWPRQIPGLDNGWADKFVHFGAYLVLTVALAFAWRAVAGWLSRYGLVVLVFLVAIHGALDELTQPFFNRSCSPFDWLADVGGAVTGALLFARLFNRSSPSDSEPVTTSR